jgi:hypothetical protein
MYRIIYDKATGKILISRRMSDELLAQRLANYPTQGSIDGSVQDIDNFKVNLDTLAVEAVTPVSEDLQHWLRLHRDGRLKSCDWTQGADSPLSDSKKAEWATYRQQLRDLPASYSSLSDKDSVTWPTKPE